MGADRKTRQKITVVGVGPANGFLTERAIEIISRAEVVFGSRRALELASKHIRGDRVELTRFDEGEIGMILKAGEERKVVVLSTGDPMVSGLGKLVKGSVEPGISSVQLALARLGIDLCEVAVVNAHARESYSEILRALKFRNRVLVLADRKFNPGRLVELVEQELQRVKKLAVLTNLGMENEEIIEFDGAPKLAGIKSDLAILYVETDESAKSVNAERDRLG